MIEPAFPEPQRTNLNLKESPTKKSTPTHYFTQIEIFFIFFYLSDGFGTVFAIYTYERYIKVYV